MARSTLEQGLLRLVAGPQADTPTLPDDWTAQQWQALDRRAAEHRLRPLLHRRWGGQAAIPPAIAREWASAYRSAAITALHQRGELLAILAQLDQAGIPALALKGAWLAWHAYGTPAERPLRDLDLLVPADRALAAQALLTADGCVQDDAGALPLAEWARRFKHLPPLTTPQGTVVEIHTRLWDEDGRNPAQPAGLFARAVADPAHPPLSYPAPDDMLMHLAIHAAFHRFDGGPLMLVDFERMLATVRFDWPLLWVRAHAERWDRPLALALALTDRWVAPGTLAASHCPLAIAPALLDDAAPLLAKLPASHGGDVTLAKLARRDLGVGEKLRRMLTRRERFATTGGYLGWLADETGAVLRTRLTRPGQSRALTAIERWLVP